LTQRERTVARAPSSRPSPARGRRRGRAGRPAWTESLETRRLLSAAAFQTETVNWHGANVEAADGRWIVTLDKVTGKADAQLKIADKLAKALDAAVYAKQWLVADGTFLFDVPTNYGTTHVLNLLSKLPGVKNVEPDIVYHTDATPNDTSFGSLWGLNTGSTSTGGGFGINAKQAWDLSTGNSSTVVADIDTGMQLNHPDLAANLYTNPGEIAGNGIDDDGNGFVDDVHGWNFLNDNNNPGDVFGHGTHTAGTIGAVGNNGTGVTGVNWNVKIMPLKVGGNTSSDNTISTAAATAAFNYVTMMKNRGVGVRVTNNSWGGGGFDSTLQAAMQSNANAGIIDVCAAGNNATNNDSSPSYPASYNLPNIIAVAAITSTGALASFSNYGATSVDIGAPGASILSTYINSSYATLDGTSMATPHVAGAAAFLFGMSPNASYQTVRDALLNNADATASLSGKTVTGGRLNLYKAALQFANVPDLASASDSGSSSTDNITNDTTPTLTGKATAGAAVQLMANGVQVGSATADASGNYTITSDPLTDGSYDFSATWAGSTGTAPLTVIIDTVGQAPTALALDAASDTGSSNSDGITKLTSVKVNGATEGGVATLFVDGVARGTASLSNWAGGSISFTGVPLGADGVHVLTASIVDLAGNASPISAPTSVTVDTVAATPSTPVLNAASDTGVTGDGITKLLQPRFDGTAEAGALKLTSDGVQIASVSISGGTYSVQPAATMTAGTHVIAAQLTDAAGNVSGVSGNFSVTIDNVAPVVNSNAFVYTTGPQRYTVSFSENVAASIQNTDLFLQNTDTGTLVPFANIQANYDAGTNTASFTFPGYASGILPDGNYQVLIANTSFSDPAGNNIASNIAGTFYFVGADANHDRTVDLTDFTVLAANFNGTGKTFDQGDFNYDGTVDLTDFTMLASKFNFTLAAPAAAPAAVASATAAAPAPASPSPSTSLFSDQAVQGTDLLTI
jgi:subtilisin family serine protease